MWTVRAKVLTVLVATAPPVHSATRHRWTADTRLRRSSEAEGWFTPDQASAVRAPERQEEE